MRRCAARSSDLLLVARSRRACGWVGDGRAELDARRNGAGEPWDVNITVLQHGRDAAGRRQAGGDDPQRRRDEDLRRDADRQARRLPRARSSFPTAGTWTYEINDGFISRAAAHVPGRCRSAAGAAPAAAATDDGGPNLAAGCIPGIALLLAAVALLLAARPARRAPRSRRRRESHHPRRRWPRLRGGGDDDRRLRRRRLRPDARAGAPGGAGGDATAAPRSSPSRAAAAATRSRPRTPAAAIGPDLALSLHGKSRDYVLRVDRGAQRGSSPPAGATLMPDDFAQRIAPEDLDPLVAYLMKGARVGSGRVRPRHDPRLRPRGLGALLRHRPRRPRQAAALDGDDVHRVGMTSIDRRRRRPVTRNLHIAFYAPTHELVDAFHRAGVDAGYAQRRRARPAPAVHAGVLRRLPARPRRQQHRGRLTRRASASRARSTTCGCARPTSPRAAAFYATIAPSRARGPPTTRPTTCSCAGDGLVLVRDGRASRPRTSTSPSPRTDDATVDAFHAAATRRRLPRQRRARASAPSTTPATTAPSSSTPTATTSRPSTTTAEQRAARLDLRVVDEVVHAREDVELHDRAERRSAPPTSRARARAGTQPSGIADVPR